MRSKVAEELREEQIEFARRTTPTERVKIAFDLGERAVQFLMRHKKLDRATAATVMKRFRHIGRRPSKCADPESGLLLTSAELILMDLAAGGLAEQQDIIDRCLSWPAQAGVPVPH